MATTRTIQTTPADFATLRPGDRITALGDIGIDGLTVAEPYEADRDRVRIVNPHGTSTVYYIYSKALTGSTLTVEQPEPKPEPAPKKDRKPVTRTIDGLRLVSQSGGAWRTEDGHFEVRLGYDGLTFCEGPHPVRVTSEMRQWAQANPTRSLAQPILTAIRLGKRGYLCEGEAEHQSPDAWQVWDLSGSNVDPFEDTRFESFTEAAQALARHLHDKA